MQNIDITEYKKILRYTQNQLKGLNNKYNIIKKLDIKDEYLENLKKTKLLIKITLIIDWIMFLKSLLDTNVDNAVLFGILIIFVTRSHVIINCEEKNIKIIDYDKIINKNYSEINKIEDFIELLGSLTEEEKKKFLSYKM